MSHASIAASIRVQRRVREPDGVAYGTKARALSCARAPAVVMP